MSAKATLFAATLGGAAIAGLGMFVLWPGPAPLVQGEPGATIILSQQQAEEDVLRLTPPGPANENGDLVPHATPEEVAAIARDFFARPTPTDAELAAMVPFTGTENVAIGRCAAYWPKAAEAELRLASATPTRRMKDEIYGQLSLRHVLGSGNCTCAGKVAPFEPVALVLAEITKRRGEPNGILFDEYATERRRLRSAVERLCAGNF